MSSVLKDIPVSEVMSIKVFSISSDKTVEDASNLMHRKHFGGLPVVDDKRLVGIITLKEVNDIKPEKRGKTKVKDVMTKQVVTISPHEKVSVALEKMSKLSIMRLPVVSGTDAMIGVITLTDIKKASKDLQHRKLTTTPRCKGCGATLKVSISHTVTCEYCGLAASL